MSTMPAKATRPHGLDPEDEEILVRLAGLYQLDMYTRLVAEVEAHGKRLSYWPPARAHVELMRGYALIALGDYAAGLASYADLIEGSPDDPRARDLLRNIRRDAVARVEDLRARGSWHELEALCRSMSRCYGVDDDLEWQLGVTLDQLGRSGEAEVVLATLVARSPLVARNWHSLALVQAHQGDRDRALATCHEGVATVRAACRDTGGLMDALGWLSEPDDCEAAEEAEDSEDSEDSEGEASEPSRYLH
jgi:predicted Zn-dependent protease